MAITDILLRSLTHADLTTKGSELTFSEGDTNWIEIYEALKAINSGGGLAPYNAGTTYTSPYYVSYASNIWLHVSPSPTVGVTPGTNPAVWQLSSIGMLAHQQNTDTMMGMGTASEVTATEIRTLLDNCVITVTRAALISAITAVGLRPGYWYFISDRNVFVRAATTTKVETWGVLYALNPDFQATSGYMLGSTTDSVWDDDSSTWWTDIEATYPSPATRVGKNVIYKGKTYSSLTGLNTATAPDADATNWGAGHSKSYIPEMEVCRYHLTADLIMERRDVRGNVVIRQDGDTAPLEEKFQFGNDNVQHNYVDGVIDMNISRGLFLNNVLVGGVKTDVNLYRNGTDMVGVGAQISGNRFDRSTVVIESNKGDIVDNTFHASDVDLRRNTVAFNGNNFKKSTSIDGANNDGTVEENDYVELQGVTISLSGGGTCDHCYFMREITYDASGSTSGLKIITAKTLAPVAISIADTDTTIDIGYRNEAEVTITGGTSATITEILSSLPGVLVRIKPDSGMTLTVDYGVVNIISPDGTPSDTLDGSSFHYLIGTMVNNRFEVIKVVN